MFRTFLSTFILFSIVLVVCDADKSWRPSFHRRRGCQFQGCPSNQVCGRRTFVSVSPRAQCLPDIRVILQERAREWDRRWNRRDFHSLEELLTKDSISLVPSNPVKFGLDRFAEDLQELIDESNWGHLTLTLSSVKSFADDAHVSLFRFKVLSTITGNHPTLGNVIFVFKKVGHEYLIDSLAATFDS